MGAHSLKCLNYQSDGPTPAGGPHLTAGPLPGGTFIIKRYNYQSGGPTPAGGPHLTAGPLLGAHSSESAITISLVGQPPGGPHLTAGPLLGAHSSENALTISLMGQPRWGPHLTAGPCRGHTHKNEVKKLPLKIPCQNVIPYLCPRWIKRSIAASCKKKL